MNSADPRQVPQSPYKKKPSKRLSIALLLILGPTVLVALSFILYAIMNFATNSVPTTLPTECQAPANDSIIAGDTACTESLFGTQPAALTAANIVLFGLGSLGIIAWLPGMIIGAILIATRPKNQSNAPL